MRQRNALGKPVFTRRAALAACVLALLPGTTAGGQAGQPGFSAAEPGPGSAVAFLSAELGGCSNYQGDCYQRKPDKDDCKNNNCRGKFSGNFTAVRQHRHTAGHRTAIAVQGRFHDNDLVGCNTLIQPAA